MRSAECGVRSAECGVRSAKCEVRTVQVTSYSPLNKICCDRLIPVCAGTHNLWTGKFPLPTVASQVPIFLLVVRCLTSTGRANSPRDCERSNLSKQLAPAPVLGFRRLPRAGLAVWCALRRICKMGELYLNFRGNVNTDSSSIGWQ